jgi:hypothetical protein
VLGAYGAIGGVTAAVALGIGDPIGSLALALLIARRSRAAGACWSAAAWSSRCTRAIGSASRS